MLLCTAGHVDHGKSSLIRALTGTETDTLAEEKKRGLTIELGFAYTSTPQGNRLGFVDVPGHSKFIRNMAAGVAAVDIALLVVDANEGIKPQTREHIALLSLFGIQRCILVITKIDLLEKSYKEEQIQALTTDCDSLIKKHDIEPLRTVFISSQTGEGIDSLKQYLHTLADTFTNSPVDGMFRLAADRIFSIKGTGTVVTGTVYAGEIDTEARIILLPSGHFCRVKGMYVDGAEANYARAGNRAALNLTGVATDQIVRGDWICSTDQRIVSNCIDVQLSLLDSHTVRHWQKVHVHGGSSMVPARISLYDHRVLEGGDNGFAQLVFEKPLHCVFNDLLVLRDQNALQTMGNARVLDPYSNRTKEHRNGRSEILRLLDQKLANTALSTMLANTDQPLDSELFRQSRNLTRDDFESLTAYVDAFKTTINRFGEKSANILSSSDAKWLLSDDRKDVLQENLTKAIDQYHESEPYKPGINRSSLFRQLDCKHARGQLVFAWLIQQGILRQHDRNVSRPNFIPSLTPTNQKLLDQISSHINADNLKPPSLSALAESLKIDRQSLSTRLVILEESGFVVRIAENRIYHPEAFKQLVRAAITLNDECGDEGFEAKAFRDRTGIGRNLSIDVLEYMDVRGLTRRIGDRRVVRQGHQSASISNTSSGIH